MSKIVNIDVRNPIRSLRTPLSVGKYYNVEMSVPDIFSCICARAYVDEVLSDGSLLRLDLTNYFKDNNPIAAPKAEVKPEPVKAEPKVEPKKEEPKKEEPKAEERVEEAAAPVVEEKTEEVKEEKKEAPVTEDRSKKQTRRPHK